MPCRRARGVLLLAALGLSLPVASDGSRRAWSNQTAGWKPADVTLPPALADIDREAVERAWRTANAYVGHRDVMALSDLWTTYNNLLKVKDVSRQNKATAAFVVTGEYFTTWEALEEVDRSFTRILGIKTMGDSEWDCSQYYPGDPEGDGPKMTFERSSFMPFHTFESFNSRSCLRELKTQLGFVRWSICHIEETAKGWASDMAAMDFRSVFIDTAPETRCTGEQMGTRGLGEQFRPRDDDTCVNRQDHTACAEECFLMSVVCSAVDYEEKRRRCCFLTGDVSVESGVKGHRCFQQVRPREMFLMLGPKEVAAHLRAWGFGKYVDAVMGFGGHGLTGMVLSFMTEPVLMKWLGMVHPVEAEVLRCRILAELENDPLRTCGVPKPGALARLAAASPVTRSHIDYAFLWPKGANGKWNSLKWVSDFLRKYPPTKEVKAWSSMAYDMTVTVLNAQKLYEIAQGGPEGLKDPRLAIKAVAAATGLWKFREAVSPENCWHLKAKLDPVIAQLMEVPMRQESSMHARLMGARPSGGGA